ncbi:MAG: hypothetical protein [Wendovervirus sonii]|uniref:Uncharacterized protein n=1 Tax=phage Lak_Megaphage_Sonny TaxID=3109229 RepID=A0ABZ0Z597_9CAUD|nr:MAG: hypothetical protein [phage Lak_Megaphage_Sonny]
MKNINETYGITEFDNNEFDKAIEGLFNDIFKGKGKYIQIYDYDFLEIDLDLKNITTWADTIKILYTNDMQFLKNVGEAIAITENYDIFNNTFYENKGNHLITGTILVYKSDTLNIGVIYHEIAHLFDSLKIKINNNDTLYYFNNFDFDLPDEVIKDFDIESLHNLIKYSMYHANNSEKHAFIESARFEIIKSLSNFVFFKRKLIRKGIELSNKNLMIYSSSTLSDFYWMVYSLKNAIKISDDTKKAYMFKYGNDLKEIYRISDYDKLIYKLYKELHHSYINMCKLFNYYIGVFNVNINNNIFENLYPGKFPTSIRYRNRKKFDF